MQSRPVWRPYLGTVTYSPPHRQTHVQRPVDLQEPAHAVHLDSIGGVKKKRVMQAAQSRCLSRTSSLSTHPSLLDLQCVLLCPRRDHE